MKYLIEREENTFHIDVRIKKYANQIIKDLKDKNYKYKRKFSFYYMHKHDYFYLNCGIVLSISYAHDTLYFLKRKNLYYYNFKFDLNPYND